MDEMASSTLSEIEELIVCSCCKRVFDEAERPPKLLACKHHFCLACTRTVLGKGREVYCVHCWKRTELPDGRADALPTHGALLALARHLATATVAGPPNGLTSEVESCTTHALPALWCAACSARACRACDGHTAHAHALRSPQEARALLSRDVRALLADLQRLTVRQRDFLLRALDAATALKVRLETELAMPLTLERPCLTAISLSAATAERDRLRARHSDALVQCRLDDLIRNSTVPLDFETLRRALSGFGTSELTSPHGDDRRDPVLFLANYCTAQLYARHCLTRRPRCAVGAVGEALMNEPCKSMVLECDVAPEILSPVTLVGAVSSPLPRNPSVYPLFYFNLEVNGAPFGRIVIEVRSDVAPRMARNFTVLASGELGVGYRGCAVFQCWENESVITGDFELNNGRGGRSVFEESYFMPDDTKMVAVRGSVGMRRSQKRHDNLGLVGSQFRIILREMRGFTAIFASVVEGLELVDRLSRAGDSAGKPHSTIIISSCGKLN